MQSNEQATLNIESTLERLKGDKEFLHMLYQVFLEDLPAKIDTLDKAIQAEDLTTVHRAAHSLKGACATIGADMLHAAAHTMETTPKANGCAHLVPALDHLKKLADDLSVAMQQEIKKNSLSKQP
ncbi:Hpt domain-containing protein [Desulfovibrio ferrophilus]|uniref:Multi-sensor hybrid histidine kinase n=1 Tax=Desulfovibrio ferrophilus TaxID=241368 RepID=A0A2Z6AUG9_9BACT|nr:Hpt domain-containing protein [Desulfovibrio ferrophilus]BBD06882.1 multi-sensor hybrid histidine kinase [Desulfovibrio ferrophilus]